ALWIIHPPRVVKTRTQETLDWKRANPMGSLLHLKKYPVILGLVASIVLVYIAAHAIQSTWSYYTMEKFHWNEAWVGYSLAFVGLMIALVQGVLIRSIIPRIGQKRGVYVGLGFYSLGLLLLAFANQSWMMFAFLVPYCLGGIAGPSLQGIMSTQVPPNEQGELQGALSSLISVTMIIGPPLMTNSFAFFTGNGAPFRFPGAPMFIGALLTLASALIARRSLHANLPTPQDLVKIETQHG
ncbi:MAG: MFS transporter, partial [Bacteroidota bacterium]